MLPRVASPAVLAVDIPVGGHLDKMVLQEKITVLDQVKKGTRSRNPNGTEQATLPI